jgi:hypothetical protein
MAQLYLGMLHVPHGRRASLSLWLSPLSATKPPLSLH